MRYANVDQTAILRDDGAMVPCDPANTDYQLILASGVEIAPYARFASLDEAKASKLADLSAMRVAIEERLTVNGVSIKFDAATRAAINDALAWMALTNTTSLPDWQLRRGEFGSLTIEQLRGIAIAGGARVQACFAVARRFAEAIAAAQSITEVESINLTENWP